MSAKEEDQEQDSATQIAQPAQETASNPIIVTVSPLSDDELYQLKLYRWRYILEANGFDQGEVRELMFLKWLNASRRVEP